MLNLLTTGLKIPIAGPETINFVKEHGEDISYSDGERFIEAYTFKNHLYIASIEALPERG